MVEEDLGQATIVYEEPDGETAELTVENEHIAYFQDHWAVKVDEDERGDDRVRRIPHQRVYYVERSVEEFEEEVKTIQRRIESFADDLREKLPVGGRAERDVEVHRIEVESGEPESDVGRMGEPGEVGESEETGGMEFVEETDEQDEEES